MSRAGWGRRKEFNIHLDAATAVDRHVIVADADYELEEVRETHAVAGTDAGAVTAMVRKSAVGTTPAGGTAMLSATLNLKSAANTPVKGSIVTARKDRILLKGRQLALDITGVTTGYAGGVFTIIMKRLQSGAIAA